MARSPAPPKAVFHTPLRFDWTDEKLKALSQAELLSLLENLDRQRAIGRMSEDDAAALDRRIAGLLTGASITRRRKTLARLAAAAQPVGT